MILERPVGIDLGTTNSEIALLEPSERDLVIYTDRFGRKTVPSAVAHDPKVGVVVGHAARARRGKTPPPIESIKRKMGAQSKVDLGGQLLLPEEISAKILGDLRAKMVEYLAAHPLREGATSPVHRAVITVPAYFDAPQMEATRKAGEIAGLEVLGILQEPTAAAIYHTWRSRLSDGNFLVYDLGGGTFDVSVLRCVAGEYQVLAIDGDNYLGGDDLDRRYAEHLRKELSSRGYALDLDVRDDEDDRQRFGRLVHLAQEIKESLSTALVVNVSKEGIAIDKAGESISYEAEISRADYEKVVGDLIEVTIACCERALARSKEMANVGVEDIDHVVLVGGSTRVPLVARRVAEALCKRSKADKPLADEVDTCVALGAAVHAAMLGGLRIEAGGGRVLVTTPLVGHGSKLKVGLRIEEVPAGTARVEVRNAGGQAVAMLAIDKKTHVQRIDVPLGEAEETPMQLAFVKEDGKVVADAPLTLYRGDVRPRASTLSRPSVIAKDIALEVVRGDRRDRKVLLARGTGLPATVKQVFFTGDQSGAVVLRILQNRLPIHSLVVNVPRETPVGTPVDLTFTCDETMRMHAHASCIGKDVRAAVEPPALEAIGTEEDVETLLEEADVAGAKLWGHFATIYKREADLLSTGIREVLGTDPDKTDALCRRLRSLIDEYRGASPDELSPPMSRFEESVDRLRRVVFRASGPLLAMSREQWEARIDQLMDRATKAYRENDATTWRRAFNEVQALYETAHQEEFASTKQDDPSYVQRRLVNVRSYADETERTLRGFVPAATDAIAMLQIAEQARLLAWLRDKAIEPLGKIAHVDAANVEQVRTLLSDVYPEIERVQLGVERLPSIGLVTDRGGS